jgi:fatty acid-binding protein DegV
MSRNFGIVVDSMTLKGFKQKIFKDAGLVSLSFLIGSMTISDLKYSTKELINFSAGKKIKLLNPAPELFIKAYEEQKSLGYEKVIYLASHRELTDCMHSAELAQTILNDPNFIIIDTKTFGPGIVRMLELIDYFNNQGMELSSILDKIQKTIDEGELYFTSTDFKPFVTPHQETSKFKQRVSKIIPHTYIISLKQGIFKLEKKYLTSVSVEKFFLERIKQRMILSPQHVKIFHNTLPSKSKELQHEVHHQFKEVITSLYGELSFAVGKDLGSKSVGIYISDYEV